MRLGWVIGESNAGSNVALWNEPCAYEAGLWLVGCEAAVLEPMWVLQGKRQPYGKQIWHLPAA